jgi:hypothetical protein
MTVWIYVDTCKAVGDRDHLKSLPTRDAAEVWANDPEGVAFEYQIAAYLFWWLKAWR